MLNEKRRPKIPIILKRGCKCYTCRTIKIRIKIGRYIIVNDDYAAREDGYKYVKTVLGWDIGKKKDFLAK